MSDVELLVKIRDGAQLIADACAERLETMAPAEVREHGDFDTLHWESKQPKNGEPYEQARHEDNKVPEFEILQKRLQDHRGFLQTKNYKFWFHMGDLSLIDRRHK